jgi:hypothetical protein
MKIQTSKTARILQKSILAMTFMLWKMHHINWEIPKLMPLLEHGQTDPLKENQIIAVARMGKPKRAQFLE